jgi:UDP-N-acetylglucosamine 2-epimerase
MKKVKILHVVGARPQFVKMALVAEAAKAFGGIETVVVHTGQHYDRNMSDVFFNQLKMSKPKYNLGVGAGSQCVQMAGMIEGLARAITKEAPDAVFVYGDTTSTLAGAVTATKIGVKLAHVEAGLRSFNRSMPEEINRVMTDSVSDILFCPTDTAVKNLRAEGITRGVFKVEDVMLDMLVRYSRIAAKSSHILKDLGLRKGEYYLTTIHRSYNTDDPKRLKSLMGTLGSLDRPAVLPLHPRTKKAIKANGIVLPKNIIVTTPVTYIDMLWLEKNAAAILTDSGGVQKEAFFLKVPCVTLREETEWVETVKSGWNVLAGVDDKKIKRALAKLANKPRPKALQVPESAARRMIEITLKQLL